MSTLFNFYSFSIKILFHYTYFIYKILYLICLILISYISPESSCIFTLSFNKSTILIKKNHMMTTHILKSYLHHANNLMTDSNLQKKIRLTYNITDSFILNESMII